MSGRQSVGPCYAGRIVDGHCHLASTRFIPPAFLRGAAANLVAQMEATGVKVSLNRATDLYVQANQDHGGKELLAEMDTAAIDRAVVLLPDMTYALPCDLTIAEMFERTAKVREDSAGRFEVFAGVDPRWGKDGVDLFERGVREYGFRGLKLYPPCGYSISDRRLYPYYEICASLRLPVLTHTGPTSPVLSFEWAHPSDVDAAARDFAGVRFILAHAANYVREVTLLCAYRPNVFADLSGFLSMPHPSGWQAGLREFFRLGVNHKLIFGTDWPVFRTQANQARAIERFVADDGPLCDVSPEQQAWLMHGNIERILAEAMPDAAGESTGDATDRRIADLEALSR